MTSRLFLVEHILSHTKEEEVISQGQMFRDIQETPVYLEAVTAGVRELMASH